MKRVWRMAGLAAVLIGLAAAWADLRDYAPDQVTVSTSSQEVLAADNRMKTVTLTNVGSYDVWICLATQTAVAQKGWYLPAKGSITFDGDSVPQRGLNGIAVGGDTTVAIGKG